MSSSIGYSYSYVDLAAQERRRQRAEIARLNARLGLVRAQAARARGLGAARVAVAADATPRATADSAELDATIRKLTEAVAAGEAAIGHTLDQHWSKALRRAVDESRGAERKAARSAPPSTARQRSAAAPSARPLSAEPETARRAAAEEAGRLLAEAGARCAPEDLERISALCESLDGLASTPSIRERAHEIRVAVTESVHRHEAVLRAEGERARLLALLDEVPPALRGTLAEELAAAADPAPLARRVAELLDRADAARRRRAVAEITARALRGIGCVVPEDFDARLTDDGLAVAPFADSSYGLLIRFTAGRDRVAAAVVRRDDEPADLELDVAAQRGFCAGGLEELTGQWTESGLDLRSFHRAEPGDPPPGTFDARVWDSAGVGRAAEQGSAAATQAQARRRHR